MAYNPLATGHSYQHEMTAGNDLGRAPSPGSAEDAPDEYVVRVLAKRVAPVDEDGQATTHRALTSNQASAAS
jgi:hypothetical protein